MTGSALHLRSQMPELALLCDGFLSDVTVVLPSGTRYQAHRTVLAVASGYFHSLFAADHGSPVASPVVNLDVPYVSHDAPYLCAMELVYGRDVSVEPEDVEHLAAVARFLLLDRIEQQLAEKLVDMLSCTNCAHILHLGTLMASSRARDAVVDKAVAFIAERFDSVLPYSAPLFHLPAKCLEVILLSDSLVVENEAAVFNLLATAHEDALVDDAVLFDCVRFQNMTRLQLNAARERLTESCSWPDLPSQPWRREALARMACALARVVPPTARRYRTRYYTFRVNLKVASGNHFGFVHDAARFAFYMSRYSTHPRLERVWTTGTLRARYRITLEAGHESGTVEHTFDRDAQGLTGWPNRLDANTLAAYRGVDGGVEVALGIQHLAPST